MTSIVCYLSAGHECPNAFGRQHTLAPELGDGGYAEGTPEDAEADQAAAKLAREQAGQTAGATPSGLAAGINAILQPLANQINDALNGFGIKMTSKGLYYTSLTDLPPTPNTTPIANSANSPDQLNYQVNWNFISYGDMASAAWNSPGARLLIADMYSINLGGNFALVYGGGLQTSLHLITRGPNAGVYWTYTTSTRWGLEANVGWSVSKAWYTGPVDQISINTFLDSGIDFSGSYVISGDIFGSKDQNGNYRWIGGGAGEEGLGGSYGNTNTILIAGWKF